MQASFSLSSNNSFYSLYRAYPKTETYSVLPCRYNQSVCLPDFHCVIKYMKYSDTYLLHCSFSIETSVLCNKLSLGQTAAVAPL